MDFIRVVEVIDGNTIAVSPSWKYDGYKGRLIRIRGLGIPKAGEIQQGIARCRLMFLVNGCIVGIRKIHGRSKDVLVCDVEYSGRNVTEHLYEYAVSDESPPVEFVVDSPPSIMMNLESAG